MKRDLVIGIVSATLANGIGYGLAYLVSTFFL